MATDPAIGSLRARVARGTLTNFAGRGPVLVIWFLLTPFILHQLGNGQYGLWVLAGSVVGYGSLLDVGIATATTKYVAQHVARGEIPEANAIVATALRLFLALGLIALLLALGVAVVFDRAFPVSGEYRHVASPLILLLGITVAMAIPASVGKAVLVGLQRYDVLNLINTGGTILSAIATVIVLLLHGGLLGMAAVNVPVPVLTFLACMVGIRRVAPSLSISWRGARRSLVRPIVSFSSSNFLLRVSGQLQMKTDEVVIGLFLPVAAIAPYAVARRLADLGEILAQQLEVVIMPLASQLHSTKHLREVQALYVGAFRIALATFVPIAAGITILARPFLVAWVGPGYADASILVVILTLAAVVDSGQRPAVGIMQGVALHRPLAHMAIGIALANVILSVVLVQRFGVVGVALGTLIPAVLGSVILVVPYSMRVAGVKPGSLIRRAIIPALVPAIPAGLLMFGLRELLGPRSLTEVAVIGIFGLAVYAAVYLRLGASEGERGTYLSLVKEGVRLVGVLIRRRR